MEILAWVFLPLFLFVVVLFFAGYLSALASIVEVSVRRLRRYTVRYKARR